MAFIVPADITPAEEAGLHSRELETLSLLKKQLNFDYTVFHSVHWSRSYEKYTVFGEVDFVVVNLAGDILLIEQKNGALDEIDGQLIKRYGSQQKNPVDQVVRSRDHIIEKFRAQYGGKLRLSIDYLVYCPDHKVKQLTAAALDRSRIVDGSIGDELPRRIEHILGSGRPDPFVRDKVNEFFQHTFHLVPDIHSRRRRLDERFVRLSEGLINFIDNLAFTPFRLRVVGTAGCGKSLLASHRYARSVEAGKRTLLLCFNRPLAEMLQRQLPPGGTINSWHGFCRGLLRAHGVEVDFGRQEEPGFWVSVTEQMLSLELGSAERFDTLTIDEAQEFEELWWLLLKDCLLEDDAEVIWLEDETRGNRVGRGNPDGIAVTYRARDNYRSPYRIARYINRSFPEFEFEPRNGIVGLDVKEYSVANAQAQLTVVDKAVKALLRQGLLPADIAILTCGAIRDSVFHGCEAIGGCALRQFTGDYDGEGEPVYSPGEMRFTSVARFQGQQAPAVILVDVDLSDGPGLEERRRVAFIGMTRASLRLDVIKNY